MEPATAPLDNITVADALKHPNWSMGKKITIDSATMMNKGLELIEACHLFGVSPDDIEIIIHRESIIHSLAQFKDKSVKAQMSLPDMKMCIQYALTCGNNGKREKSLCKELDLTEIKNLSFAKPDNENFPFPELARFTIKEGGTLPAVMNAANEIAVELFLKEKISFLRIFDLVQNAVQEHKNIKNPDISDIIDASEDIKRHFIAEFA
jgi:1-deoxy-D-xylulose-5-phosphate reductoisomerase